MSQSPALRIHTDGASRGNPGAAAFAFVIEADGADPIEGAGCLGTLTNNQAEYTALVRALEHALELGPQHHLIIHSDSELLVKQMNGQYRVKNVDLRDLYREAQELRKQFTGGVTIRHVRREQNSRADELCNEALDGKRPSTPRAVPAMTEKKTTPLRDRALVCLHGAAAAWRQGASEPPVEQVWAELVRLLEGEGVRLPAGAR